jgi:sodium-type flagellar protein MotY
MVCRFKVFGPDADPNYIATRNVLMICKTTTLCICLSLILVSAAQAGRHYSTPLGQERWKVKASRTSCVLSQDVQNYGRAVFWQSNISPVQFILESWQGTTYGMEATLMAKNMPWQQHKQLRFVAKVPMYEGKRSIRLDPRLSKTLLRILADGELARFRYDSESAGKVRVDVSAVSFQDAYAEYMKCVGQIIPLVFADVADSDVYFGFDSDYLTPTAQKTLQQIIDYVSADLTVSKIHIEGYTDSIGRAGYNRNLSERRSRAVVDYLLKRGVKREMIKINWHGSDQARGKVDSRRVQAKSRRVNVKLYR